MKICKFFHRFFIKFFTFQVVRKAGGNRELKLETDAEAEMLRWTDTKLEIAKLPK